MIAPPRRRRAVFARYANRVPNLASSAYYARELVSTVINDHNRLILKAELFFGFANRDAATQADVRQSAGPRECHVK